MTWSEALDAYLTKNGIPNHRAAAELGVAPSTVHYWRKGSEPRGDKGRDVKARVEAWTGGEIKASPHPEPSKTSIVVDGDESIHAKVSA